MEMALNPRITSWRGQVVWLVGASTGIGRATAARLHALGATVIVSARSAGKLDAFVARHAGAQAIALDATDRDAVRDAAARIVAEHGRIDLAVYCAGTYRALRATAFDLEICEATPQTRVPSSAELDLLRNEIDPRAMRRSDFPELAG